MTAADLGDTKLCLGCAQPFHRRPAPLDSSFRWMRRKFCSGDCARGQFRRGPVKAGRKMETALAPAGPKP